MGRAQGVQYLTLRARNMSLDTSIQQESTSLHGCCESDIWSGNCVRRRVMVTSPIRFWVVCHAGDVQFLSEEDGEGRETIDMRIEKS